MKTQVSTPPSSSSVNSCTTMMIEEGEQDRSESRDSCYFPGCRKDANCNCEICLASFNATLDLMPISIQKSSLSKFSSSKSTIPRSPVSFHASILSTPVKSGVKPCVLESPSLKSTGRIKKRDGEEIKRKEMMKGCWFLNWILVLGLVLTVEFGLPRAFSGALQPKLSHDIVSKLGEKASNFNDFSVKFGFLERSIQGITNGQLSNGSYTSSKWHVNQNDLLLHSSCTLYRSALEEVSIWGWPLQTSGLLTTTFSLRTFTILSGRVTEWPEGKFRYVVRKTNSSWVQDSHRTSAVQLDQNTWVLEYRRSLTIENTRLSCAVSQFLKFKLSKPARRMRQKLQFLSESKFSDFKTEGRRMIPT